MNGEYKMKFGTYKGIAIEDLPMDYLEWIVDNLEPDKFNNNAIIEECQNQILLRDRQGVVKENGK